MLCADCTARSNGTQYGYDPNGNLTSVTDANNHTTTYAYDAGNRKIGRTLPLGIAYATVCDVYFVEGLLGAVDAPDVSPMFQWCVAMVGGGRGGGRGTGERNWEKKLSNPKKEKIRQLSDGSWQKKDPQNGKWRPCPPPPLKEL